MATMDWGKIGNDMSNWWSAGKPTTVGDATYTPTDKGIDYNNPNNLFHPQQSYNVTQDVLSGGANDIGKWAYNNSSLRDLWGSLGTGSAVTQYDNNNLQPGQRAYPSWVPLRTGKMSDSNYDIYSGAGQNGRDIRVPTGTPLTSIPEFNRDLAARPDAYSYLAAHPYQDPTQSTQQTQNTGGNGMFPSTGSNQGSYFYTPPPGTFQGTQGVNPTNNNGAGMAYTPPWGLVPASVEDMTKGGLQYASYVAGQAGAREHNYPGWWGSSAEAPQSYNYVPFQGNAPMATTDIPGNYQGLMGGDYNRLEQSLRQPGEIAAQNAYNQGNRQLNDVMNARGMYGSSVMGQQANEGLNREYQNTLASNAANAAATRYGMEQGDLQYGAGYGLQQADLNRQQNLDQWKAGLTDAGRRQDYSNQALMWQQSQDEAQRNFANSMLQGQYQHQLARDSWQNALDDSMINRGLAIAGRGAPLVQSNQNYQLAQDAANANQTAGLWQAALNPQSWDALGSAGNAVKSGWDWLSGLWG